MFALSFHEGAVKHANAVHVELWNLSTPLVGIVAARAIVVELIKLLWGEAWSFAHFNNKGNDIYSGKTLAGTVIQEQSQVLPLQWHVISPHPKLEYYYSHQALLSYWLAPSWSQWDLFYQGTTWIFVMALQAHVWALSSYWLAPSWSQWDLIFYEVMIWIFIVAMLNYRFIYEIYHPIGWHNYGRNGSDAIS
jgi:hypothetical protein